MAIFFKETGITHLSNDSSAYPKKNENINIKDIAGMLGITSSATTQNC